MLLLTMALTLTLIGSVNACYNISDGIDGYVYCDCKPVEGITIHVYRKTTGLLEGYGVKDDLTQGDLGTDITDSNGYFHIAWLYAVGETYIVEALTPAGTLTQEVVVNCGTTTHVEFCYKHVPTLGYWRHEFNAWIIKGGLSAHENYDELVSWCNQLGEPYDLNDDGKVTLYECQTIYNSVSYKDMWHPLTDELNTLAGYL